MRHVRWWGAVVHEHEQAELVEAKPVVALVVRGTIRDGDGFIVGNEFHGFRQHFPRFLFAHQLSARAHTYPRETYDGEPNHASTRARHGTTRHGTYV